MPDANPTPEPVSFTADDHAEAAALIRDRLRADIGEPDTARENWEEIWRDRIRGEIADYLHGQWPSCFSDGFQDAVAGALTEAFGDRLILADQLYGLRLEPGDASELVRAIGVRDE